MISKADIERLPTTLRESIAEHLLQCMQRAEKASIDSAQAYVMTTLEVHRATALQAKGEHSAFSVLYNIFK